MTRAHYEGVADQPSALGPVLTCTAGWTPTTRTVLSRRSEATATRVLDADVERLSAFVRAHIGLDGHDCFHLPDFGGSTDRCDPDTTADE